MSYACLRDPATCDSCEGFGTTCRVVESRSLVETATSVHRLRDAIAEDAASVVGLAQLISFDIALQLSGEPAAAALPLEPARIEILNSSEEAQHVDAARPLR